MDSNFKKMSRVRRRGDFIPPPYAADAMIIMYPLRLRGYMISMQSAA